MYYMKKWIVKLGLSVLCTGMLALAGCGKENDALEEPPMDVLHPDSAGNKNNAEPSGNASNQNTANNTEDNKDAENDGNTENDKDSGSNTPELLEGAVSTKIGLNNKTSYSINMYDNGAVGTILGYLSGSEMRFPTYTYDGEIGYVAQHIRGNYTREDEVDVEEIHAGELYLFSDGQLRLYFKDIADAGITATPIGYFVEDISGLVEAAYEENLDDSWGVDVYFLITKN